MKQLILKLREWVAGFALSTQKPQVDQTLPVPPKKTEIPWKDISVELYEALKACCALYPLAVSKQKAAMDKFVKAVEDESSNQ